MTSEWVYLCLQAIVHSVLELVAASQVTVEDTLAMTLVELDNNIFAGNVLVEVEL